MQLDCRGQADITLRMDAANADIKRRAIWLAWLLVWLCGM
jgi:hypothetical protein